MKTATARLKSIAPYSQRQPIDRALQEKGESESDFENRIWREGIHANKDGYVFIPPMAFKNCLSEAAKYLSIGIPGQGKATYTKHFEAGLLVLDPVVFPIKKADADYESLFVPSNATRGSGKRVWKRFSVFHEWSGEIAISVLDDKVLQTRINSEMTVLEYVLREAGSIIGVGRFRPRNNGFYGRFMVESFKV